MLPSFMNRIDDRVAEVGHDRRRRREAAAVDREPAQRVVADPDDVLGRPVQAVVALRGVLRLDDEGAQQATPDLVGRVVVRVVHVRPGRARHELVGEARARLDRLLGDVRHAVHRVRHLLAVEMDAGRLVHVVLERRADRVALDDVSARSRPRPVEAEGLDGVLLRIDAVVHLLDRELEDLHAVHDRRFERLVAVAVDLRGLAAEEPVDGSLRHRVVVDRRTRWRRRRGGLVRRVVGVARRRAPGWRPAASSPWSRGRRPIDPAGRGPVAAGAQAAIVAATSPPPVRAPARNRPRRVIARSNGRVEPGADGSGAGCISMAGVSRASAPGSTCRSARS